MPPVLTRLDVQAMINASLDRLNNVPLGLGGLRAIGTQANQAAPGTVVGTVSGATVLTRSASAGFTNERVVTDTATVTWDWTTPGQAKANAAGSGMSHTGTATLDFGASASNVGTLTVTGQTGILSTSSVILWFQGTDSTTDNTAYTHGFVSQFVSLSADSITAGTGFTGRAISTIQLTGTFKVRWAWG